MTSPGTPSARPTPAAASNNSVCPRCGAAFRCGMVGGDSQCWCVQLPQVMPVPGSPAPAAAGEPAASCFCPACLKLITDERSRYSAISPARN